MTRIGSLRLVVLCFACSIAPQVLLAQPTFPVGSEFQVNSRTQDRQQRASVAVDGEGDFVVAWDGPGDGDVETVLARRFNSAGIGQAIEFQVNSHTAYSQHYPVVAVDSGGDFVVAWQSAGQDGGAYGIFARRFNAAGIAQAVEFQVNSQTLNNQNYPAIASDADGDFVIVWEGVNLQTFTSSIFARRFDSSGVPQAAEFLVNVTTEHFTRYPAVAMDDAGDFVVVWQNYTFLGIVGRRFDSAGTGQGLDFQVSSATQLRHHPAIDLDADGDFVVAWYTYDQDGSESGVFARRFSSAGVALANEFQVNSYATGDQFQPAVVVGPDGDFSIVWSGYGLDGSSLGIIARRFNGRRSPGSCRVPGQLLHRVLPEQPRRRRRWRRRLRDRLAEPP